MKKDELIQRATELRRRLLSEGRELDAEVVAILINVGVVATSMIDDWKLTTEEVVDRIDAAAKWETGRLGPHDRPDVSGS